MPEHPTYEELIKRVQKLELIESEHKLIQQEHQKEFNGEAFSYRRIAHTITAFILRPIKGRICRR
jgi:hypothetical protein